MINEVNVSSVLESTGVSLTSAMFAWGHVYRTSPSATGIVNIVL